MNGFQTVVYSTLIRYADGDYKNCMFLSDGSGSPIQELDHNGTFLRKEKQSSKLNYISVTGGCHKHELEINFSWVIKLRKNVWISLTYDHENFDKKRRRIRPRWVSQLFINLLNIFNWDLFSQQSIHLWQWTENRQHDKKFWSTRKRDMQFRLSIWSIRKHTVQAFLPGLFRQSKWTKK